MENIYEKYQKSILTCLANESIFQNFKNIQDYTEILEHVSFQLGAEYLLHIWKEFQLDTNKILEYSSKNDRIGNPQVYQYAPDLRCSPSSIRYIYQALLILKHMKTLGINDVNVIEVGCGYGGLCLAIDHFSSYVGVKISSYSLIDLDEPSMLQQKYLSNHTLTFPCKFYSAKNHGLEVNTNDTFFISNYCFSEIPDEHQKKYLEVLMPKCTHGFIVWNAIPYYNIGKTVRIEEERPQTDVLRKTNRFVFF